MRLNSFFLVMGLVTLHAKAESIEYHCKTSANSYHLQENATMEVKIGSDLFSKFIKFSGEYAGKFKFKIKTAREEDKKLIFEDAQGFIIGSTTWTFQMDKMALKEAPTMNVIYSYYSGALAMGHEAYTDYYSCVKK